MRKNEIKFDFNLSFGETLINCSKPWYLIKTVGNHIFETKPCELSINTLKNLLLPGFKKNKEKVHWALLSSAVTPSVHILTRPNYEELKRLIKIAGRTNTYH
jgi:Co/Zn/Cd efflux system component